MNIGSFTKQFNFSPFLRGYVGVERESFITNRSGIIVPQAIAILEQLPNNGHYGYELSACQLETRTEPCQNTTELRKALLSVHIPATVLAKTLGLKLFYIPVALDNMPLDVYPDPSGRYQAITKKWSTDILLAACRVAGTHIHLGVSDGDEAIRAYNNLVEHFEALVHTGNISEGERLKLYRLVAPDSTPILYESWDHFYHSMLERGYAENPRECRDLIRISIHGTVEVRVFDSTPDIAKIVIWAEQILKWSKL